MARANMADTANFHTLFALLVPEYRLSARPFIVILILS